MRKYIQTQIITNFFECTRILSILLGVSNSQFMDNVERTKIFFDSNVERLKRLKYYGQSERVKETARTIKSELQGKVLDIGGEEKPYYSLDKIDKLILLNISSASFKREKASKDVECICGDARSLPMKNDSFDRVLMLYIIHHLAADNLVDTYKHVEDCFKEAYRVLNNSGKVLVADVICPKIIQKTENIFFNFSNTILKLLSRPMVYFFSVKDLIGILDKVGFKKISFSKLNTGNARLSLLASPINIPFRYTPLSHFIIRGVK